VFTTVLDIARRIYSVSLTNRLPAQFLWVTNTTWVLECFFPELDQYLSEELPPRANIFVDRTGIRTGDAWRQRLKKAVTQSRCVV
jgi:hypothetical protein